jgi:hypothetical protein
VANYCRRLAVILLFVTALWAEQGTKVYTSPDGILRAVVVTEASGEDVVEFKSLPERVILRRDERSSDGEHGDGIVKAAWTPDSQFFIASIDATSGHRPWARPLWVHSRARNSVFELRMFRLAQLSPPEASRTPRGPRSRTI